MFNLDCFNPYTTEVHREYVAVAGHGAWLAFLFNFSMHVRHKLQRGSLYFYTPPHNSVGVLWYHIDCPSGHPFVVHLYFLLQMITYAVNGDLAAILKTYFSLLFLNRKAY